MYYGREQCGGQLGRGTLKPVFVCCGGIGVIVSILGAVVLALGHSKLSATNDYTYIVAGSISLGFGLMLTIAAVFLTFSWAKLNVSDHESGCHSLAVPRMDDLDDDLELEGYEEVHHRGQGLMRK